MFTLFAVTSSLINTLISLAVYLLSSYAIFKVAKIRFIPNAWLAFIPFFSLYMIGYIGDSLKYNHYKFNAYLGDVQLAYALPIAAIIQNFLPAIPLLGGPANTLVSLLLWAAQIMVYYFIFSLYSEPKQILLFTVLSIIPVVGPLLILYALKDRRY